MGTAPGAGASNEGTHRSELNVRTSSYALLGCLLLAACGGTTDALGTGSGGSQAGPAGAWVLTHAEPTVEVPDGIRITLTVEDPVDGVARVGGTAACNGYGGEVDLGDGGWAPVEGGFAITEMGCEPAVMAAEQAYMTQLAGVTGWARTAGDTLELRGDGVLLRFTQLAPVEPAALEDTTWELDGFVHGSGPDGAVSSTVGGAPTATVQFLADGTFRADTGCQGFDGEWTTSGDTVQLPTFGRGVEDREPCSAEAAEAAAATEEAYLQVLESSGFTATVDGQRLTLQNGEVGLTFRATG